MTSATSTARLATTEPRSGRVARRAVDVTPAGLLFGDLRATRESLTHQYSLPVVRELPPRFLRSVATW